MKAKILTVLGAAALAGVGVWLAVEHHAQIKLGEENAALRQQLDQAAGIAAENERLSNLVAQASSSQSLSAKQLQELLRLRGEVGPLRQQGKELDALRNESRQLRAALANSPKSPTNAVATADYWPRDSWTFTGYATPDAALQSAFWAASKGDLKTFVGGLTGKMQQMVQKDLDGKSETEASARIMDETSHLKSIRVLSREAQADNTVLLTLEFDGQGRSGPVTRKLLMNKVGNDWKLSGRPE